MGPILAVLLAIGSIFRAILTLSLVSSSKLCMGWVPCGLVVSFPIEIHTSLAHGQFHSMEMMPQKTYSVDFFSLGMGPTCCLLRWKTLQLQQWLCATYLKSGVSAAANLQLLWFLFPPDKITAHLFACWFHLRFELCWWASQDPFPSVSSVAVSVLNWVELWCRSSSCLNSCGWNPDSGCGRARRLLAFGGALIWHLVIHPSHLLPVPQESWNNECFGLGKKPQ